MTNEAETKKAEQAPAAAPAEEEMERVSGGCYQDMFNGCKGIEKAPELPAPTLVKDCYKEMFYDCSKLNHVC